MTTYMLRHGIANRDSLRACSNGIRGILDVGASDDGAAGQEQSAADVEVGVRAFRIVCQWPHVIHDYAERLCPAEGMDVWLVLRAERRQRTVGF